MSKTPTTDIINPLNGMYSVRDQAKMFAVRKIGKNVPFTMPTFWVEEAEEQAGNDPTNELVRVVITPYNQQEMD